MTGLEIVNLILLLFEGGAAAYTRIQALRDKMEAEGRTELTEEERNVLAQKSIDAIDAYLNG